MRRALAGLAAVLLVAVAVVAHLTTPTREELVAPIATAASEGEWGEGRAFAARLDEVTLTAEPTDGDWVGTTDGVWVVATLTAVAKLDPGPVTGSLFLGEDRYDASGRAGSSSLDAATLSPGLPEVGDLLFEVPADALAAHGAEARLWLGRGIVPRLDSVVEIDLDLGGLEPEPAYELTRVERVERVER